MTFEVNTEKVKQNVQASLYIKTGRLKQEWCFQNQILNLTWFSVLLPENNIPIKNRFYICPLED